MLYLEFGFALRFSYGRVEPRGKDQSAIIRCEVYRDKRLLGVGRIFTEQLHRKKHQREALTEALKKARLHRSMRTRIWKGYFEYTGK